LNLRVVLVEPEHEGNIGAVARLVKNFGFSEFYLLRPQVELGSVAKVYAMHADEVIDNAVVVDRLDQALRDVSHVIGTTSITAGRGNNLIRTAITLDEFVHDEALSRVEGSVALLLGRESRGLSNDELARCDVVVTIPTSPRYKALNLASAAAILLYAMRRSRTVRRRGSVRAAEKVLRDRLLQLFGQLVQAGLGSDRRAALARRAFRNVVSRAFISRREATLLIGAFRRAHRRLVARDVA
jgi:TrmH family RNA methyltransferase